MELEKLLNHSEIDMRKYEMIFNQSSTKSVFMEPWVLDLLAPNWQLLVYGDYDTVLPVVVIKKFGFSFPIQPPFLQQFIFLGDAENKKSLLHFLSRKFLRGNINIGHLDVNLGDAFSVRQRPNYILNLNNSLEELNNGFSKDASKNLRKLKDSGYKVEKCSPSLVIETYKKAWGEMNKGLSEKNYQTMLDFLTAAIEKNRVELVSIYDTNNELLAAGAFLKGSKRLHYILGGPTELGKTNGATHALIYEIIKQYAGTENILDFEGSSIEGVAYFYQKFGAVSEPFQQVSWSRIPFDSFY